jgi:hypothetical protein
MFAKSAGILVLAAVLVFASAGQHSRCPLVTSSRWPLGQEKAWFSGKLKTLRSGDSIDQLCDGAYTIEMEPMRAAGQAPLSWVPMRSGRNTAIGDVCR